MHPQMQAHLYASKSLHLMASSMLLVAAMTCSTGDLVEAMLLTSTILEAAVWCVCVRGEGR